MWFGTYAELANKKNIQVADGFNGKARENINADSALGFGPNDDRTERNSTRIDNNHMGFEFILE